MIYITGDCHGDYTRFSVKRFPEQKELKKSDYMIVCGDFGFWHDTGEQRWWLKWLTEKPFTILWVDGNHENFDLLKTYPVEEWHGGKVQYITPSVLHLMRGQVYEIEGKTFFTFGGARSHDAAAVLDPNEPDFQYRKKRLKKWKVPYRVSHVSWWQEELPDEEEMEEGVRNLERHHNRVDYIVTHCAPVSLENVILKENRESNVLTRYLEAQIRNQVDYEGWFFGHYHGEGKVGEKEVLLYEHIFRLL